MAMDDIKAEDNSAQNIQDEKEFKEFKRLKRIEEAKALIARIECDSLSSCTDKPTLKGLCKQLNKIGAGAIVVLPSMVKPCVSFLGEDPACALIAAISYPHGGDVTETKVAAVKRAVKDGVDEVEVYAPLAIIKDGNTSYFKRECKKLKKAAKTRAVRMVFDCDLLTEGELVKACIICADCGIDLIRLDNCVDTGLLARVKSAVKDRCLFKAGGCENFADFQQWVVVGANSVCVSQPESMASLIMSNAQNS
jgi:deoxyribose-phosphate aldolase